MRCTLCGKVVSNPCVGVPPDKGTVGAQIKEPSDIKECGNFQDVANSPRGANGGLVRFSVEVDTEFDLCPQGADRELPPDEVRKYVPDFDVQHA